jgi:hypothetical protein
VITGAAAGNPNVKALIYVAAFAPEAGEPLSAPAAKFAPPAINSALVADAAGFLYVDRAKFHDVFCKDLSIADARVMAATQKPVNRGVFGASVAMLRGKQSGHGTSFHRKIKPSIQNSNASTRSASAPRPRRSRRATYRFSPIRERSPESSRRRLEQLNKETNRFDM